MATSFKSSCGVFWLIWMSVLSVIFGFDHIQRIYTYEDPNSYLTKLMMTACILAILMAAVGCCCVKLEVSNLCCAFCYLSGFMVAVVIVSVVLLLTLQTPDFSTPPHEFEIIGRVKKLVDSKGRIPRYLHNTQIKYRCCGVLGFKDYRAFMLTSKYKEDVPYSCCRNHSGFHRKICYGPDGSTTGNVNIFLNSSGYPIKLPSKQQYRKYEEDFYGSFDTFGPAPQRFLNAKLRLPVNTTRAKYIHLNGCYEHLRTNTEGLLNSYSVFSAVLLCFGLVMGVVYTKSCFQAGHLELRARKEAAVDAEIGQIPGPAVVEGGTSSTTQDLGTQEVLNELVKPKKKLFVGEGDHGASNIVLPPTDQTVR